MRSFLPFVALLACFLSLLPACKQAAPAPKTVSAKEVSIVATIRPNSPQAQYIAVENAARLATVHSYPRPLGIHRPMQSVIAWSPDASKIAGTNLASNIMLFDAVSGQAVLVLDTGGPIAIGVAFSSDGTTLAAAVGKTASLYSSVDGKLLASADGQDSQIREVAFSPDGKMLAFGNDAGLVQLWNIAKRKTIHFLKGGSSYVLSLDYTPDGGLLAEGSVDGNVRLWNPATGKLNASLHIGSAVGDLEFSPDGTLLATASDDGIIRLWDHASGQVHRELAGHRDFVNGLSFSPDGLLLASGSHDKSVGIWDVRSGNLIIMLGGHEDAVLRVAFSPDGRSLASISWDGTIRLWAVPE